jgi:4-amino-4-deoxy-L-arabinose transferase-like glycosyltransferase
VSTTPQTTASAAEAPALGATSPDIAGPGAALSARVKLHHLALAGVLALSTVLNTHRLAQNGYANIFYSAGVKSMLLSLHNFAFASFDSGGLVTIDKPPLALWAQVASAKVFGFSPLSLLLPEAIMGVLTVALLYRIVSRGFGPAAGLAAALALAVFPSFVGIVRDNGVDPLLILLMLLACGAALRAIETGRWRTLVWCGVLVGLAFNAKTLAAFLVVPGIALGYAVCAPAPFSRRVLQLMAAGLAMVLVSAAWIAFVDLTPASKRPYAGSSTNNSEVGLTFEYNGFGRVEGQVGGPGHIPVGTGALVSANPRTAARHTSRIGGRSRPRRTRAVPARPGLSSILPNGRNREPIPFAGPVGPLRLFGLGLGDQSGWMLPFAFFGLLAVLLLMLDDRRGARRAQDSAGYTPRRAGPSSAYEEPGTPSPQARPGLGRRDPRLAGALVLGGWFLVEASVLSLSKGIVHPYYTSALAPGAAAMVGVGVVALSQLARSRRWDWRWDWRVVLIPCAVGATVLAQVTLLHREHYMHWFVPVLIAGAAVATIALLTLRRLASVAMACTLALMLVAPTAYTTTTWLAPVEGTFPAAGPTQAAGAGGVGVGGRNLRVDLALLHYVRTHGPGSRWAILTDASDTAAPFILLDLPAGALGGYGGTDPVLDGPGLARLLSRGQARYVVLGGEYSTRGGNRATVAVKRACRELPPSIWGGPRAHSDSLVLFDCAGRERALTAS